jgi:hypothetical protein
VTNDPACNDSHSKNPGGSAAQIFPFRKQWYGEGDERISCLFLCVAHKGHFAYPVYGQMADSSFVNPYQLRSTTKRRFVEEAESYCLYTRATASPRDRGSSRRPQRQWERERQRIERWQHTHAAAVTERSHR